MVVHGRRLSEWGGLTQDGVVVAEVTRLNNYSSCACEPAAQVVSHLDSAVTSPGFRQPVAAPRVDAPGFTNEIYLTRVLADARRERETFWPEGK